GGFDVLSLKAGARASLIPFLRYERYNTQADVPAGYESNPETDVTLLTVGAVFKPIEPIALKFDWQQRKNAASAGVNQWNMGFGFLFQRSRRFWPAPRRRRRKSSCRRRRR